jgi:hypothetical protein
LRDYRHRWCNNTAVASASETTITGAGVRDFGHLVYRVDDIYDGWRCGTNRPRRDGNMTLVRSPDGISIELLQKDDAPLQEPWGIHGQHREEGSKRCAIGSRDFV